VSTPLAVASSSPAVVRSIVLAACVFAFAGCAEVTASSRHSREQGQKLYSQGEYVDAAGAFNNAVRTDPLDYRAWYGLGQSYDKSQSYHQSIQAYRTALDMRKRTLPGREDEAMRVKIIDALGKAIAAGNDAAFQANSAGKGRATAEEKYIEAKALQYMGDADSAIEAYQQATLLDRKDFAIAKDYGLYLEKVATMRDQAVKQLKRAYQMNQRDPEVVAALRRNNVVPGPSLKEPEQLAKPGMPMGPLPEIDIKRWQAEWEAQQNAARAASAGAAPGSGAASTTAGPRD
jgi:tetratricopeptide (TPR) repeat protein